MNASHIWNDDGSRTWTGTVGGGAQFRVAGKVPYSIFLQQYCSTMAALAMMQAGAGLQQGGPLPLMGGYIYKLQRGYEA